MTERRKERGCENLKERVKLSKERNRKSSLKSGSILTIMPPTCVGLVHTLLMLSTLPDDV